MRHSNLFDLTGMEVEARLVAVYLDLRKVQRSNVIAHSPLTVRFNNGAVVIFRYGVVVFFNMDPMEKSRFVEWVRDGLRNPLALPLAEELEVVVDNKRIEGMLDGRVIALSSITIEKLQLIAEILGKNLVLDYYEKNIAESFDSIEPLAADLLRRGSIKVNEENLLKHLGSNLLFLHNIIGRVEVSEKPEVLWEHPELNNVYIRLENEYELGERHLALERKIDVISKTAETLIGLSQNRHSNRLEWYIIVLILIEIVLSLYQIFGISHL